MDIHEHQAKEIFRKYGVPTPNGYVVYKPDNAVKVAQQLGGDLDVWVVKAQIHAGGRGKAGGVKLAKSTEEVGLLAKEMLGSTLVTHQTGANGKKVNRIYIEEGVNIEKEFYLGMVLDRSKEMPVMMASSEGGIDIEEVADKSPEKIVKVAINPTIGFRGFYGRKLAFGLGLPREQVNKLIKFAESIYNVYMDYDASLIEINPLVLTKDKTFIALDAKMSFDDNSLYRQPEILTMRDLTEEEPVEVEANKHGLSYVKLDGNVGCMVNGAGLAMSTMDIIKHEGGTPANFLDVGGGANAETVAKGFEIILSDPNVKSIFVNIFGGIVRCDRVAQGILEAAKITNVNVPVVVRLDGTNAEEAQEILANSGIKNIIAADSIADGARKAISAVRGN
ncbi:Succinyl-CoA ligase (ADP-forming) subunit beta [Flexistipes sinusarabici DSM 4947]|uniref:Succinate--CoA ligase [ADP-forming] subunit beta n=1 Tax=Flexistipes sinusarabici (strain ATCC 49648 / DSM 4947 / MAS 10) TaxID=717231 RepID=F8E411_FLESM|nr:ADP-forming succinate--CoA ligase subunit beta [Flexistipes sinusarabici]AEI14364.1 Succinyl-CoA ligase (ADP-forming) subunit beta [Flexistipes sinusarabici DSM 4947]